LDEYEFEQQLETLDTGFWLFDTPCTQALWNAVMGSNPSRFESPTRPVEQVSWDDCQEFLLRIQDSVPNLQLALPTESQWECACRAGNARRDVRRRRRIRRRGECSGVRRDRLVRRQLWS